MVIFEKDDLKGNKIIFTKLKHIKHKLFFFSVFAMNFLLFLL